MKCRPAVGAAAEPSCSAYTVWYLFLSSSLCVIYGGRGISPSSSRMFSNTPSYSNLMIRLPPSMTSSTSAISLPPPKEILSPGFAFLPGRTSTSHVSISLLTRRRISIAAPVPTLSPYNLAGSTFVLLMTRQSPAFRYSLISLKCLCSLSPLSL